METVEEIAFKHALANAHRYGKANVKAVMGKVLAERPDLRPKARELLETISRVVERVNSMKPSEVRSTLEERWPELLASERREEEKGLPPLPNVERFPEVRTRFAPNPDAPLHLGAARPIVLCKEYARMYRGKFILRFEDTSPDVKPPIPEAYDWILEDLRWLDAEPDEVYIQSDRLELYYGYAKRLIETGGAYVCTCRPERFRELVRASRPCPCRSLTVEENLERWERMLDGTYREGEAVVRVKTDLNHPNPAVRDWPALRIKETPHPRVGGRYRVWPLYNFSCGIDDHEMRISHIIRGKEHIVNTVRQRFLYAHMGWEYPEVIHVGRLGVEGGILSKSKIRAGVEAGLYRGWDDPRLLTLMALRRRGIQPETIRRIMLEVGVKPQEARISWENLAALNRKIVDPKARRYFFVKDPIRLVVSGAPTRTARLPLHPNHPEWGYRELRVEAPEGRAVLVVSRDDLNLLREGAVVRLMGLYNVKVLKPSEGLIEAELHSLTLQEARKVGARLIHWLPEGVGAPCTVVMPDASEAEGLVEPGCLKARVGEVVQFERFGFVRVDSLNRGLTAYYAHR